MPLAISAIVKGHGMMHALAVLTLAVPFAALAIQPPTGFVSRTGDQSVVLHWEPVRESNLAGYRIYRSLSRDGSFALQNSSLVKNPGFCDLDVTNGQSYYYQVAAVTRASEESSPSTALEAFPHVFAGDDEFLEYVQQTSFDYFWYGANPTNGLIADRFPTVAPCSIAAVGFGLTAIGIGIDHGWITRAQGLARVRTTLTTFLQGPQGPEASGTIGYKGWFYHFLDMRTAVRYAPFDTELSSIDTALLLAGILYAQQYFDGADEAESEIRSMAGAIVNRVDWQWMARNTNVLSMGWKPGSGFLTANWEGYNEAMILYILGMGASSNSLPASSWTRWTNGYAWSDYYGHSFVPFPPLFGHQYSHCWIDFRHIADAYMKSRDTTYFENSRRATLAQRAYCMTNPLSRAGYSSNVWGLTACDGPKGYAARGAPPRQNDDGTIAPTAAGGSIAFTPEYSVPALRHFYHQFRRSIWTAYGFRDAFNLGAQWWGPDELGIDQGPIVIMIENYRTQKVWRLFMKNQDAQRGLQKAGFVPLSFMRPALDPISGQNAIRLTWSALASHYYQVEYSPDLMTWFNAPPLLLSPSSFATWTDDGPPETAFPPFNAGQRFYRVCQLGEP
jgi:hypothetical protein